ncbi:MAG: alpha/beta fold hydrolase [Deltaproteobacteria bacterium]|nr:alpha/beta fold hydrolase [Deltaproteobacteria bacterium]NND30494.1 alpha/beta fold hydrolase [Myxococcales bacterium]MBT8465770.1 alpha/beta fold hydrolase [Deltaproteobacteria bacterium]MBT8480095.1 alpha/beta fold hydrolase [Deltaproteobacteria bacterium]NNK06506.1 alpha/beta fold hydrolase [Myxococcales bacterium]
MEQKEVIIHGKRLTYRLAGKGPLVLLIHGMAGSATTWKQVMPALSERFTVLAPDLFGHGESDKTKGDYSLGAMASVLRDLIIALGFKRATVVGQSYGGGIAMQLAYQYPERCERLVLVNAGGLGTEVNPLLRMLTLPGSEAVLLVACAPPVRRFVETFGRLALRKKLEGATVIPELWRSYSSLGNVEARRAFLRTLRAVIDPRGQAVSANDKLYLAAGMPTLIIWGEDDRVIPVEHAYAAHTVISGSWLEIIEDVGHYPHCEAPERFVTALTEFIESTRPARIKVSRKRILRPPAAAGSESE